MVVFEIGGADELVLNATNLMPETAGGLDLGHADNEFGDIYIGDKSLKIGAAQEHSIGDLGPGLGINSDEAINIGSV